MSCSVEEEVRTPLTADAPRLAITPCLCHVPQVEETAAKWSKTLCEGTYEERRYYIKKYNEAFPDGALTHPCSAATHAHLPVVGELSGLSS